MPGLNFHGCKAVCKQAGGHEGVDPSVKRHRRPGMDSNFSKQSFLDQPAWRSLGEL